MGKCQAGYDIPWEGPCPKCGATENDRCKEGLRIEAEIRAERARKRAEESASSSRMQAMMDRDDKRTHGEITQE